MKTFFLVLAYNEEEFLKSAVTNLKKVIDDTLTNDFQIIIVDDGSTDKTANIALTCKTEIDQNIIIQSNKKNIGGAKSIQKFLKTHDEGKLIVVPGDNDMNINLIKKLIIESKKNDFVISFYINREVKGYLRSVISYFFNFLLCTIFQVYAFYLQGPFVWPIEIVKNFNLDNDGVTFISEINVKLLKSDLKFTEISGTSNVGSYKSTAISFKNIFKTFKTLAHLFNEIYILKKFTKNSVRNLNKN
tara:strand:+ start:3129 stop:3863 length:735 start_codon:yes stop_codon:yes gene_type:complete